MIENDEIMTRWYRVGVRGLWEVRLAGLIALRIPKGTYETSQPKPVNKEPLEIFSFQKHRM